MATTTTTASSKEEQALKAHALAEKCFLAGNFPAARQWMQSAVRLAPDLPGTRQIVAAYDVHAAAAQKNHPDWYAVLGLKNPATSGGGGGDDAPLTHEDIKRQHRRLCLLVHPDKNPSAAADGAFKLVHAAWHALSAKHPPLGAAAPDQQPAPRPQRPPPEPQPQRRRPTYSQQARQAQQKGSRRRIPTPPRPPRRFGTSPLEAGCPSCGAHTINGRSNHSRCMSCKWSPLGGRHDDDYDDDFHEFDY